MPPSANSKRVSETPVRDEFEEKRVKLGLIDICQQNLLKMIEMIESHHKDAKTTPRIIIITPPPMREHLIFQYILVYKLTTIT